MITYFAPFYKNCILHDITNQLYMKQLYRKLSLVLALLVGSIISPLWGQTTFSYTGTIQTYTVPLGVSSIEIYAEGAQGGNETGTGGFGARMQGNFAVTPGQVLDILVGQQPLTNNGGGGGTFVVDQATGDPLIIAGGGGGGAGACCGVVHNGVDAVITEDGTAGLNASGGTGAGGTGGNGGFRGTNSQNGGAGGGFFTAGEDGFASYGTGGQAYVSGGAGGTDAGGYGGGGGTSGGGGGPGGGGGGYSGGGSTGGGGQWGGGGGGGSYNIGTDQINSAGLGAGNGEVVITELCSGLTVDVPDETTICEGTEITLSATSESGATVTWDMDVIDGEAFAPPVGTTTYTAYTVDPSDCDYLIEIIVNALPEVTATVDVSEICVGEMITMTGGGATDYTWDPADIEDGVPYAPDAGDYVYTVTGTDDNGCENDAEVAVTVYELPAVVANASSEELCLGEELTLSGEGATTYDWAPGAIEDGVAFVPEAGIMTYVVTGTDDNGCINEADIEIVVFELPDVTASADADEICFGAEVTLTGDGAETYDWDPDGVEDGIPYTVEVAGVNTFTVTGTDANGCENTAAVDVNVLDEIIVTVSTTDEIMGGDGAIDITVSGGLAPHTFDWDNDGTGDFDDDEDLTDLTGGTYVVVVLDDNGCTTTLEVNVTSQLSFAEEGINLFKVYPNPTNGAFMIAGEGQFSYTITTANGKIIQSNKAFDSATVDLSDYADGIYFVTVQFEDDVKTLKVTKK